MSRTDNRAPDQLRSVRFTRHFTESSEGSVLVEIGRTRILCTVSAVPGVPRWMRGRGTGWLTAEYAMLPGSVEGRKGREFQKRDGRSVEIQRLIGRTLRSAIDLAAFPDWTLHVDCDVLQADGGTRCAAITGASVALHDALTELASRDQLRHWPFPAMVAAVSVGMVADELLLDLDYGEDSTAQVDMNVAATANGDLIEVQGTAEGKPFPRATLDGLTDLALAGITQLGALQRAAVQEEA